MAGMAQTGLLCRRMLHARCVRGAVGMAVREAHSRLAATAPRRRRQHHPSLYYVVRPAMVKVAVADVPRVLGAGGATIKRIEAETGAKLRLERSTSTTSARSRGSHEHREQTTGCGYRVLYSLALQLSRSGSLPPYRRCAGSARHPAGTRRVGSEGRGFKLHCVGGVNSHLRVRSCFAVRLQYQQRVSWLVPRCTLSSSAQLSWPTTDDSNVSAKVHRCCGLLRFAAARDRLCPPRPAFYTSHGALTALRSVGLAVAGDSATFPTRKHAMNEMN